MACRSIKRAETARLELLKSLDAFVADVKTRPDYDGHAERFRKSVDIVVMRLDLADLSTVFSFADELMSKYVLSLSVSLFSDVLLQIPLRLAYHM
jgi:3-keto steroid reductase